MNYNPKDVVIGSNDDPVEFTYSELPEVKRRWWRRKGDTFFLQTAYHELEITPEEPDRFYSEYLKDLKDSVESPFTYKVVK